MRRFFAAAAFMVAMACAARGAAAGELRLEFRNGLVTLVAKDVSVRQILAEWTRVGGTKIVNAEQVPASPLTLTLTNEPERRALDSILRNAGGYMASQRADQTGAASMFDRVIIMGVSRSAASLPPAAAAAPSPVDPAMRRPGPGGFRRPGEELADDQEPMNPGDVPGPAGPNVMPVQGMPMQPGQPGAPSAFAPASFPGQPGATYPNHPGAPFPAQPGGQVASPNPSGIHMLGQPVVSPYAPVPPGASPVPGMTPIPVPPGAGVQPPPDPNRKP